MEKEEVVKILQGLVKEQQRLSLAEEDSFKENGMDSLDQIELCMGAEKHFSIAIDDAEAENVENIGELADLVLQKLG